MCKEETTASGNDRKIARLINIQINVSKEEDADEEDNRSIQKMLIINE